MRRGFHRKKVAAIPAILQAVPWRETWIHRKIGFMASVCGHELKRLLRRAGCTPVRPGKGSHEIWHSPVTRRNFAIPVGIKSRHTANAILKQAGLPKAF